jgi:outer membrane cobalamin receptor
VTLTIGTLTLASLLATSAWAQEGDQQAPPAEEPTREVEDIVVVTASRTEQSLHDAPATISVLTEADIAAIPADDYGDLLRNVPGLNVSQMSARDIQIAGRTATNSLSTSQLVLVDSRTIYLDFFGFVAWDFLPVNPYEIKQIEVVRGPGSAVWGANAFSGVVNLITKSPRDLDGTAVLLGGGELGSFFGSISHAGVRDKFGYKISAAYSEQDPYDRPTGLIPGTSTPYPPFANTGTSQPKLDLRFDYDSDLDTRWIFGAGYSQTDGIIHSGIGPFDISEASLGYAKAEWNRQAMRVGFFTNILDGDADNLLTVGANGRPIPLGFDTKTYNLDFGNTTLIGQKNVLTYGANARKNEFELTLAPDAEDRDELGIYLQDEILFNDKVRWLIGARVDDMDPIGTVVSPRTSLAFAPNDDHTFRVSFNRAFRAPSAVNNYLDIVIVNQVILPTPFGPFPFVFPTAALGNGGGLPQRHRGRDRLRHLLLLQRHQPAPGLAAAAGLRAAEHLPLGVPLPQHRRGHRAGCRALAQRQPQRRVVVVLQLLLAGRRRRRRHPDRRVQPGPRTSPEPRAVVRQRLVLRQHQRQLRRRRVLDRRARRPFPRPDRLLHPAEPRPRLPPDGRQDANLDQWPERHRRGRATACVRRHHLPQDQRTGVVPVLILDRG